MITARHIALLALSLNSLTAFAEIAADSSSLNGQMVPPYVKSAMSAEGLTAMDAARAKLLAQDGDQETNWVDPKADFAGVFKISARKMRADNQAPCREYIHTLMKRSGGPVLSQKTGRALALRDNVCVQNNRWERFQGDASLLVNENGTVIAAPEKIDPAGQDLRFKNEKLMAPTSFGVVLEAFTRFKNTMESQKNQNLSKDQLEFVLKGLIAQRDDYMNKLVAGMTGADRMMDLYQLALLLPQIDTDQEKLKALTSLKDRLDLNIGDKNAVIALFNGRSAQASAKKILR